MRVRRVEAVSAAEGPWPETSARRRRAMRPVAQEERK
jgi:hypothetical protein